MTTSPLLLIRAALEARLATLVPGVDTVYENVEYEPQIGRPFQTINHLIAEPDSPAIDSGRREQGYMQVSLYYPMLAGAGVAMERATLIGNLFSKGAEFTNGSVKATINRPTFIGSGSVSESRWFVPVRIFWQSHFLY